MLRSRRHGRRSSAAQHKSDIDERTRRRASVQNNVIGEDSKSESSRIFDGSDGSQAGGSHTEMAVVTNGLQLDTEMDDLSGAMSALKFVPASIRFGRGKGKGGFSRS